jgi:hypothetical protein
MRIINSCNVLIILTVVFLLGGCSGSKKNASSGMATPTGELGQHPGSGERVEVFDLNHDNKPDVWASYGPMTNPDNPQETKIVLLKKEWDLNFDGKIDSRSYYNFKGEVIKDELDLDFDGKIDVTTFYQNEQKVRQEYDFNFDGKPDFWKFYDKNILIRTERDRDLNGRVDRWEYYIDGKLDRVGLDEDGDGNIDKWIQEGEK